MADHAVGIDFGTSTTLIAVLEGKGEPRVLPIGRATPWLPSIAGLADDGSIIAGEDAERLHPRRQIRSIKATITSGGESATVDGVEVDARAVLRALLSEALSRAQRVMPELLQTNRIFLGCPALWTGSERRILADALHEIGVDVDVADIIDEPVAAGLYSVHSRFVHGETSLAGRTIIFDAGGGTLDVAYLEVKRDRENEFTVLSAEGIAISGDAVDAAIARHFDPSIEQLPDPPLARLLLMLRARELKEALSIDTRRSLPLGAPYGTTLTLSRSDLEALFEPQLQRSFGLVKSTVRGSLLRVQQVPPPDVIRHMPWDELAGPVDHVVLVGGLSQMPVIAERIQTLFPNARVSLVDSPQESVVRGLAMGDQLNRLNLPRPPVNFVIEFGPRELLDRYSLHDWADAHRQLYRAFSPLYKWHELALGHSHLGFRLTVPFPPNVPGELTCLIRGEAPDRERSPLTFRESGTTTTRSGISVRHSRFRPVTFVLYTNGEMIISGANTSTIRMRVDRWPVLRGPNHDYAREIELTRSTPVPWISELKGDNWRFQ